MIPLEGIMETKICKLCNAEKSVDDFYVNNIKSKGRGKYYTAECKTCRNPIVREYYDKNKEQITARLREKVTCTCGCTVSKSALSRHKRKSQQHLNAMKQPTDHQITKCDEIKEEKRGLA